MKPRPTFSDFQIAVNKSKKKETADLLGRLYEFIYTRKSNLIFVVDHLKRPPLEGIVLEMEKAFEVEFRRYKLFKDQLKEPLTREIQKEAMYIKQSIGRIVGFIMESENYEIVRDEKTGKERRADLQPQLKNIFTKTTYFEKKKGTRKSN